MRSSSVVTAPPSPVVTIFRGWKLRQPSSAERAARAAAPPRAERARRVLDQRQVGQLLDPRRPAEEVHREHDRLRPRPDLDRAGSRFIVIRVDVDEHRPQPGERDDVRGRRERVRGDEHLVAGLQPEREHREVERRRARRDRDRVLGLARPRELAARTPRRAGPSSACPLSSTSATAVELRRRRRRARLDGCGCFSRYHAIVRARPSSSSTCGSQPSSSRAFSTFGIRSSTSA